MNFISNSAFVKVSGSETPAVSSALLLHGTGEGEASGSSGIPPFLPPQSARLGPGTLVHQPQSIIVDVRNGQTCREFS